MKLWADVANKVSIKSSTGANVTIIVAPAAPCSKALVTDVTDVTYAADWPGRVCIVDNSPPTAPNNTNVAKAIASALGPPTGEGGADPDGEAAKAFVLSTAKTVSAAPQNSHNAS